MSASKKHSKLAQNLSFSFKISLKLLNFFCPLLPPAYMACGTMENVLMLVLMTAVHLCSVLCCVPS